MNVVVIANPISGGHNLKDEWQSQYHSLFEAIFSKYDLHFTQAKGHATELARKALQTKPDYLVVCGGDGTLNEVVQAFFINKKNISPQTILAPLPLGSGSDFLRTLTKERNPKTLLKRLLKADPLQIDVALVEFKDAEIEDRYFINALQAGLGAKIMQQVNQKPKSQNSYVRYFSGSIEGFAHHKNQKVTLQFNNRTVQTKLTNLIVTNGAYFGSGMHPSPGAKLNDGLFDTTIIKNLNWITFLMGLPQLYLKNKFIPKAIAERVACPQISITPSDPKNFEYELDGEVYGQGASVIRNLSQCLKICSYKLY